MMPPLITNDVELAVYLAEQEPRDIPVAPSPGKWHDNNRKCRDRLRAKRAAERMGEKVIWRGAVRTALSPDGTEHVRTTSHHTCGRWTHDGDVVVGQMTLTGHFIFLLDYRITEQDCNTNRLEGADLMAQCEILRTNKGDYRIHMWPWVGGNPVQLEVRYA